MAQRITQYHIVGKGWSQKNSGLFYELSPILLHVRMYSEFTFCCFLLLLVLRNTSFIYTPSMDTVD